MRTRSTVTAAFALAAATILAVAACGTSVTGSAQPNTVAAQTLSIPSSVDVSEPSELTEATALPTDLAELTSMLGALPTDLSIPTGFAVPTDFGDLGNLNIPGLAPGCLAVTGALFSIALALAPTYLGGSETFDAGELEQALSSLSSQAPPELAADIETLKDVAAEANGKSAAEVTALLEDERYEAAYANIEAWTTANCGG